PRGWTRKPASFQLPPASPPPTAARPTGGSRARASRSTAASVSRGSTTRISITAAHGQTRCCSVPPISTTWRSPTGSDSKQREKRNGQSAERFRRRFPVHGGTGRTLQKARLVGRRDPPRPPGPVGDRAAGLRACDRRRLPPHLRCSP